MKETNWPEEFPHVFTGWPVQLGLTISPGWHDLVYDLCVKLEDHAKRMYGHGPDFEVVQVKQKMGGLRFYVAYASDEMLKLIGEAEERSGKVCEACGGPGKMRNVDGYYTTLCDEHFEQAGKDGPRKTIWGE